jgi:hypothetical protein
VLDELAVLGPFFAVEAHPPGTVAPAPWRPVSELVAQPNALLGRITATRATLAARGGRPVSEIDLRVAASAVHLAIVARIVAPALGLAILGWPVDMALGGLWWQDQPAGPVPLSIPGTGGRRTAAGEWAEQLLGAAIVPLTDATSRVVTMSGRVLRGNAASGINAAAVQAARTRPDLAGQAWQRARALLRTPWLRSERQPPGPEFRRSSCCLFYRLVPGPRAALSAICADCVLGAARHRVTD